MSNCKRDGAPDSFWCKTHVGRWETCRVVLRLLEVLQDQPVGLDEALPPKLWRDLVSAGYVEGGDDE